jgi:hypothetical protein
MILNEKERKEKLQVHTFQKHTLFFTLTGAWLIYFALLLHNVFHVCTDQKSYLKNFDIKIKQHYAMTGFSLYILILDII